MDKPEFEFTEHQLELAKRAADAAGVPIDTFLRIAKQEIAKVQSIEPEKRIVVVGGGPVGFSKGDLAWGLPQVVLPGSPLGDRHIGLSKAIGITPDLLETKQPKIHEIADLIHQRKIRTDLSYRQFSKAVDRINNQLMDSIRHSLGFKFRRGYGRTVTPKTGSMRQRKRRHYAALRLPDFKLSGIEYVLLPGD